MLLAGLSPIVLPLAADRALAQIVPDATLPQNSIVTPNGSVFTIDGGTTAGTNLFHSFDDFSVPTGSEAFFNNTVSIDNIITRVTGSRLSDIDGTLSANGTANLILLNPNGIQFGSNASLDIGGSFLGSTADSLTFADGTIFSASNPQTSPVLTVSVPVGLQFSGSVGSIEVTNSGHQIDRFDDSSAIFSPFTGNINPGGLRVPVGETLALVGGEVNLNGGVLVADSGRIELGAVSTGTVALETPPVGIGGWMLNYESISDFQDVRLASESLADASGIGGGSVGIAGANVSMVERSLVLISHQGAQPSESVTVNAAESVLLDGSFPLRPIFTGIVVQNLADADSGDIRVSTPRYTAQGAGAIISSSFNTGNGSSILLEASDFVQLLDSRGAFNSGIILAHAAAQGDAGNITISTARLTGFNGGGVGTQTFGSGDAGDLNVFSSEFVELTGIVPNSPLVTILASTSGAEGNAGTLYIETERLSVRDGANIFVSTGASGSAGTLTIEASEVEVSGVSSQGSMNINGGQSVLGAGAQIQPEPVRAFFGLPDAPTGETGNVIINTRRLTVSDGGLVTVAHEGPANAGNLLVNADTIRLNDEGQIEAIAASGTGGNITLNADSIRLRDESAIASEAGGIGGGGNVTISADRLNVFNNSTIAASTTGGDGGNVTIDTGSTVMFFRGLISAEAGGAGDGGDISIDTNTLVGLFNSDIVASAVEGNGGNITIVADAVFGLQPRPFLTPFSDINASSQFGIDGTIEITTPDVNSDDIFESLSGDTIDAGDTVAYCAGLTAADVAFTGRGGIPENPRLLLEHPIALEDLGSDEPLPEEKTSNSRTEEISPPLVEAGGWIEGRNGVQLVTMPRIADTDAWMRQATCEDANAVSQR